MNVMLDIETMAASANAAIASIGAVKFDDKGVVDTLYRRVEWRGYVSPATVKWWLGQGDRARAEMASKDVAPLEDTLKELVRFVGYHPVWGNGSDFDNAIVQHRMILCGIQSWNHRQNRCYRTMKSLYNVEYTPPEDAHNALSDALAQAEHLRLILRKIC